MLWLVLKLLFYCFLTIEVCYFVLAIGLWSYTRYSGSRIHWVEWGEEWWYPDKARKGLTNLFYGLWVSFELESIFGAPTKFLAQVIVNQVLLPLKIGSKNNRKENIVFLDLASGSGGPTPRIHKFLNEYFNNNDKIEIFTILTDIFPNVEAWQCNTNGIKNLTFYPKIMDATNSNATDIDDYLSNYINNNTNNKKDNSKMYQFRSVFGSFHHFQPNLALNVIKDCVRNNQGLIVCERSAIRDSLPILLAFLWKYPFLFFPMFIYGCLYYPLTMPLNKNESLFENIFYSILYFPLNYVTSWHDAIVSLTRSYTHSEMMEMAKEACNQVKEEYRNEINDDNKDIILKKIKLIDSYQWKPFNQSSSKVLTFQFFVGLPKFD